MKNIHLLPTDKPSRLFLNQVNNKLLLEDISNPGLKNVLPSGSYQNIYVTSDEEIKEGDWYFDGTDLVHKKTKYNDALVDGNKNAKKIILTTDKSLDSVQTINDEFLEWFVKNPSCEWVKVVDNLKYFNVDELRERHLKGLPHLYSEKIGYKIIIQKEEPNPFELPKALPDDVFYESLEPKQETLEETYNKWSLEEAQKFALSKFKYGDHSDKGYITIELILEVLKVGVLTGHKFGAKWQQERMYSEEDMIDFAFNTYYYISKIMNVSFNQISENKLHAIENLKQFKKRNGK